MVPAVTVRGFVSFSGVSHVLYLYFFGGGGKAED